MTEKKHIVGRLKHILFPKKDAKKSLGIGENKFGIIKVIDEFDEVYTIKGNFQAPIEGGTEYDFTVQEKEDPKYGTYYKLLYFQSTVDFTNVVNQKAFLKKILTQKQMDTLYETYDDVLSILENGDIEKLTKVKGIGLSTAHRIIERYSGAKPDMELITKIAELGLDFTDGMMERLKETFGNTQVIIDVLENHPYQLVKVPLIGFSRADKIAIDSGRFDWQSSERIAGFIEWYLNDQADQGNSYIYAAELNQGIIDFFGKEVVVKYATGGSNIAEAINYLKGKGILEITEDESGSQARRKVFLKSVFELEKRIAIELKRILEGNPTRRKSENWKERIEEQEKAQGFSFDESQMKAITDAVDSSLYIIGGMAGCGKTTLLKGVLAAMDDNCSIASCALSGRAAANMEGIGVNRTIHKLLDYRPGAGFMYNERNRLPYDIIVLDELSMVGADLFLALLKAIETGSRFVCLGDPAQLESLGRLCLMRDLKDSDVIPGTTLTTVHRQALESGILEEATEVRQGSSIVEMKEGLCVHGVKKDYCSDLFAYRDYIPDRVVEWFKKMMNNPNVKNLTDIMVLGCTNNRGDDSVRWLNIRIQAAINPSKNVDKELIVYTGLKGDSNNEQYIQTIREKDVVMVKKNNYHVRNWDNEETCIFNGWRGIITNITDTDVYIDFFNNGQVKLSRDEAISYLVLGYAVTVHKSQGSTIPIVIAAFSYTAFVMLNRNMLYTAITRAKDKCVVVAETNAYMKCVQTEFVSQKRTFFKEGLLENIL